MTTQQTQQVPARQAVRGMLPGIIVSIVAPFAVYLLLRPVVNNDVVAFAIGAAMPVLWTLGRLAVTRRIDPFGAFGVVVFGIALLVTWLTGGSVLALELRDGVPTAILGLACLVSVLLRRPLLLVVLRALGRRNPALARRADHAAPTAPVATSILGAVLLVHAGTLVVLAFSLPTSTYLAVHQPVGWAIIAVGLLGLTWYRKRAAARG